MSRFWDAFTVFLIGLGILALAVGLFADAYSWRMGVVGLVAFWVIAIALRVYMFSTAEDE